MKHSVENRDMSHVGYYGTKIKRNKRRTMREKPESKKARDKFRKRVIQSKDHYKIGHTTTQQSNSISHRGTILFKYGTEDIPSVTAVACMSTERKTTHSYSRTSKETLYPDTTGNTDAFAKKGTEYQ